MAIVAMANAVAGNIAVAAEYNKVVSNVVDLDTRVQALEAGTSNMLGAKARAVSSTAVNGVGATETFFQTITFTASAGRRYRVLLDTQFVFSDASYFDLAGHWAAGGTVTTAGTIFYSRHISGGTPGNWEGPRAVIAEITGMPAGTVTVGFSVRRTSGAGTIDNRADTADFRRMYIDDIGV
jgi:hypothetical protein